MWGTLGPVPVNYNIIIVMGVMTCLKWSAIVLLLAPLQLHMYIVYTQNVCMDIVHVHVYISEKQL